MPVLSLSRSVGATCCRSRPCRTRETSSRRSAATSRPNRSNATGRTTTCTCSSATLQRCPSPRLVNSLKGVSGRRPRSVRPEITGHCRKGVLWSPSRFAASCGGAPLDIIRKHVEAQRAPLTRQGVCALHTRPEGLGSCGASDKTIGPGAQSEDDAPALVFRISRESRGSHGIIGLPLKWI